MSIAIRTEELNLICAKILNAVETNGLSEITELVELRLKDKDFCLQVTNREYFVRVKLATDIQEEFHATVKAETFLKLISKVTTEFVTLSIEGNSLLVAGNGKYNIPLVYENDEVLTLPEIKLNNITNSFKIPGATLNSIYVYNSRQFAMGSAVNPIQNSYYIDDKGAITFTTGATVNKFNLPSKISLLLSPKIVKLFKLFKNDDIEFEISQEMAVNVPQTKINFKSPDVELTAVLAMNDSDIQKFPVQQIRDRAFSDYDNTIVINRNELLQAIDRLLVFSNNSLNKYGRFEFAADKVTIKDYSENNQESITYVNLTTIDQYKCILDFNDVKLVLETTKDEFVNLSFGNHQAVVCSRENIYNIIPEIQ